MNADQERCTGRTRAGRPCSRRASQGDRCLQHLPTGEEIGIVLREDDACPTCGHHLPDGRREHDARSVWDVIEGRRDA